jgi:predicted CXXCH cytochrome family protein
VSKLKNKPLKTTFLALSLVFALCITGVAIAGPVEPAPPAQGVSNDTCLACHGTPSMQTELPSGEPLGLTIDPVLYTTSAHGRAGYACVQCHENIREYPHPENTATSFRDYRLENYNLCQKCHMDKYETSLDGVHDKALAGGNQEAAVCTDCHNPHNTQNPSVPRSRIPTTCERCHSQIVALYRESVHGEALIGEGNPDVPTCTDCHGVHNTSGPSSDSSFHLFSPTICAECHADAELMGRYGVSTDVFESYVTDFHGTTVILFEQIAPDQETNKPVCIDCHGVHNMKKVDDPESTVIKENLLDTCQKCHPDATTNFPDSWLSHYTPSRENTPLIYFVNLFYQLIIPGVVGGMAIFVALDGTKRIRDRRKENKNE